MPATTTRPMERLGVGLRATAWAEDGTVEAIELLVNVLGVEWHPELEHR